MNKELAVGLGLPVGIVKVPVIEAVPLVEIFPKVTLALVRKFWLMLSKLALFVWLCKSVNKASVPLLSGKIRLRFPCNTLGVICV